MNAPRIFLRAGALGAALALASTAGAQVIDSQKISSTEGGFAGPLDDSDIYGIAMSEIGDLDGDGVIDLAVGARRDDDGGTNRGAVWIHFLNADHTVKSSAKISQTSGGFNGMLDDFDRFGNSVANLGDIDGDGVVDLAVGASGDDDGGTNAGAVWIVRLNVDGTVKSSNKISALQGNFGGSLDAGDAFGQSVGHFSDQDGNGVNDLLVGATGDDDRGLDAGTCYLLLLDASALVMDFVKFTDGFLAPQAGDQVGSSLAYLGNLDGNQADDFAVGARFTDDGGVNKGGLYIGFVGTDATQTFFETVFDSFSLLFTLQDNDRFGGAVTALGPPSATGIPIAVSVEGEDDGGTNRGGFWILGLDGSGLVASAAKVSDGMGSLPAGLDDRDEFGRSLASLGSIGLANATSLAVGAPFDDDGGADRGAVYVLDLCAVGASAVFRNDSGDTNPRGYVAGAPRLGMAWTATVDNGLTSGNTMAALVGEAGPLEVFLPQAGWLLVDVTSIRGELLALPPQAGTGLVTFTSVVPNDVNLCGFPVFTQALSFLGAPPVLHNAFDIVIGY